MPNESTTNYIETNQAQMRKGFLEYCTILVLQDKPLYSSDILTALKRVNLLVVEGTLYPLLSRLKRSGILEYEWQESPTGPPRKYYSLTKEGEAALKSLEATWKDLAKTIKQLHA